MCEEAMLVILGGKKSRGISLLQTKSANKQKKTLKEINYAINNLLNLHFVKPVTKLKKCRNKSAIQLMSVTFPMGF